jgi:amino acid transporter
MAMADQVQTQDAAGGPPGADLTMKREFTLRSAFGLAFVFISPVVALYGIFGLTILSAGPAHWWAYLLVFGGQLLVACVFAELASRYPLAGSVYQWSRFLKGEAYGWFCGWGYMWTLTIACGVVMYVGASFIPIVLGTRPFTPKEQLLVALGLLALGTFINTIGRKGLKWMVTISLIVEVVGSIGIGLVLIIFFREQSISVIFDSFGARWGGESFWWSGLFAAGAFVGWAFVGFESAGAIAEEVKNPAKDVPKAMIASLVGIGIVVGFSCMAVTLAIPDFKAILAGDVVDPVAETILFHLGEGVTRPLFALFVLSFLATGVAVQASVARVIWAYARDNVLPGSGSLKKLATKDKIPVNSILVTAVISALVLLTTLSGDIYATLISFASIGFYVTFLFPLFAALSAKLTGRWTPGPFSLGGWSTLVSAVAFAWGIFAVINIAWPRDVGQAWYLQWAIVIMIGVVAVIGVIVWAFLRERIATATHVLEQTGEAEVEAAEAGQSVEAALEASR